MAARFYSVEAYSPFSEEIAFPEYKVAFGKGMNVFTLTTADIQAATKAFSASGIRVDRVHLLDGTAAFDLDPEPFPLRG